MTTTTESAVGPRTYGNWRKAKGFGIGNLTGRQSLTLFLAVALPIFAVQFSTRAAFILAIPAVLVVAMTVVPVGDSTAGEIVMRRLRFWKGRYEGETELASGVLTDHPRTQDLPGVMAPVVPLDTLDGQGGTQGLLWDRRSGSLTVIFKVSPVGVDLADEGQADTWVASWGAFLAQLGYQPLVKHIAITIDTAPSGGSSVADYVHGRIDPNAPQLARDVLEELVARTPARSADVQSRVAVTFDPNQANPKPESLFAAAAEVTRWLPGLESSLSGVGATVLGRATVSEIISWLRIAYDPASRGEVTRATAEQAMLAWHEAGPVRASEHWENWRHDSGVSVSWGLSEAPRQAVTSRVLVPLLSPGPYPRRMTLLYEPFSANAAAEQVEAEINNNRVRSAWAQRTKRDQTQRDADDQVRAVQAAREEAQGAGVGRFSLFVTTTVLDDKQLPSAEADVEQRAGLCKLRLRRLRGSQSAGFAAALGLGINPAELSRRR